MQGGFQRSIDMFLKRNQLDLDEEPDGDDSQKDHHSEDLAEESQSIEEDQTQTPAWQNDVRYSWIQPYMRRIDECLRGKDMKSDE